MKHSLYVECIALFGALSLCVSGPTLARLILELLGG